MWRCQRQAVDDIDINTRRSEMMMKLDKTRQDSEMRGEMMMTMTSTIALNWGSTLAEYSGVSTTAIYIESPKPNTEKQRKGQVHRIINDVTTDAMRCEAKQSWERGDERGEGLRSSRGQ
jgi:hypothetical protein